MSLSPRRATAVVFAAYAVLLLEVLLNPSPAAPSRLVAVVAEVGARAGLPAVLVAAERVEFGLNVAAFAPLSLLGSWLWPRIALAQWTAAGFAGSLLVEIVQVALPARSATHADVVANTLGAALGAALGMLALRAARSRAGRPGAGRPGAPTPGARSPGHPQ